MARLTGSPPVEVRPGWQVPCPLCGEPNRYTTYRLDWPRPFFYESVACDVLLRNSDERRVLNLEADHRPTDEELGRIWTVIAEQAPQAPSGGIFSLWANIHCPVCRREIPYNHGVRDMRVRLYDPYVVLMDGAHVVGDDEIYVMKVDPVRVRERAWGPRDIPRR